MSATKTGRSSSTCKVCGMVFSGGAIELSRHQNDPNVQHSYIYKRKASYPFECENCHICFNVEANLHIHTLKQLCIGGNVHTAARMLSHIQGTGCESPAALAEKSHAAGNVLMKTSVSSSAGAGIVMMNTHPNEPLNHMHAARAQSMATQVQLQTARQTAQAATLVRVDDVDAITGNAQSGVAAAHCIVTTAPQSSSSSSGAAQHTPAGSFVQPQIIRSATSVGAVVAQGKMPVQVVPANTTSYAAKVSGSGHVVSSINASDNAAAAAAAAATLAATASVLRNSYAPLKQPVSAGVTSMTGKSHPIRQGNTDPPSGVTNLVATTNAAPVVPEPLVLGKHPLTPTLSTQHKRSKRTRVLIPRERQLYYNICSLLVQSSLPPLIPIAASPVTSVGADGIDVVAPICDTASNNASASASVSPSITSNNFETYIVNEDAINFLNTLKDVLNCEFS